MYARIYRLRVFFPIFKYLTNDFLVYIENFYFNFFLFFYKKKFLNKLYIYLYIYYYLY